MPDIKKNLEKIKNDISPAKLIAVTKYSDVLDIRKAYDEGQFDFGENRVGDLEAKSLYFINENLHQVKWHFIGNLQSNKIKELLKIPNLISIHSVSSISIVEELIKRKDLLGEKKLDLFFQINTSKEEEKSGFDTIDDAIEMMKIIKQYPQFQIKGLMTMGSIRDEDFEKMAHHCFKSLSLMKTEVEEKLGLHGLELSMGMSSDYKIALLYGANYIRIGSAIFK